MTVVWVLVGSVIFAMLVGLIGLGRQHDALDRRVRELEAGRK